MLPTKARSMSADIDTYTFAAYQTLTFPTGPYFEPVNFRALHLPRALREQHGHGRYHRYHQRSYLQRPQGRGFEAVVEEGQCVYVEGKLCLVLCAL